MKIILFAVIFIVSMIACTELDQKTGYADKDKIDNLQQPRCYQKISNKDTAEMQLYIIGDSVTGKLEYRWWEKDWNKGEFKGVLTNSIILGYYTFRSEGMTSVRQMAFRFSDSSITEGIAELHVKDDTIFISNTNELRFDNSLAFKQVKCNK